MKRHAREVLPVRDEGLGLSDVIGSNQGPLWVQAAAAHPSGTAAKTNATASSGRAASRPNLFLRFPANKVVSRHFDQLDSAAE